MLKKYDWQKNEQGFLIILLFLALFGLSTLFSSFIMPMIFAVVITCASYPLYEFINSKVKNSNFSSGIVVFIMAFIVLFPLTYIIAISSTTIYEFYINNQNFISKLDFNEIDKIKNEILSYLPISSDKQFYLSEEINKNVRYIFEYSKKFIFNGSKSIIDNSMYVIYFLSLTLFSMFFFYKGGLRVIDKIKTITPLHDDFDDLIMRELYSLCGILTLSVFSIAVIQGLSFGVLTYFMDLNWFFIAIAISLTSFVPVVGTVIVWLPLALYLLSTGHSNQAGLVFIWGFLVNGILIDNIIRPIITSIISKFFNKNNSNLDIKNFNPLDNTFLIILSNLGGILTFGIIGLFLGPIIVCISIAVFDLYIERIKAAEE